MPMYYYLSSQSGNHTINPLRHKSSHILRNARDAIQWYWCYLALQVMKILRNAPAKASLKVTV